jgi:serine/threonine protein phosphatase 1
MSFLKKLSRAFAPSNKDGARGKEGCRAYAVGDIHGRLDLLNLLIERIEEDMAARPPARTFIIFLGDFIDRGPDSAGVVERLRTYKPQGATTVFLSGNHEEVLLKILAGERGIFASWLKFGGAECAASYGMDVAALRRLDENAAITLLQAKVPRGHREFLENCADTFRFGDYLFVHAGIRPGVAIDEQDRSDLRWIRDPFLSDAKDHGFVVVHGHTIVERVEERTNRIAIDTGAYHTGILTCLVVEEAERRYLTSAALAADGAEAGEALRPTG